jgi:hypothetical protein
MKPFPEVGMQFNPTQEDGIGTSNGESQEIIVGDSGKAIVVGHEFDLESDNGGHPLASHGHVKGGICPVWLCSSSPKMKAVLGLVMIVFLGFISVMIIGVLQLPPSTSMESDQNIATDPVEALPAPAPAPTEPSPLMSEVNILLPDFLEAKVPNFSDGLTPAELENWKLIKDHIESAISSSLSDGLPTGYSVESVHVDKFDGYSIPSVSQRGRTRHLETNLDTIHTVLYSSSVTANCKVTDCSAAVDIVAGVTSDLSQLEFLRVSSETEVPTKSPVASTPVPLISTTAPTKLDTTPPTVSPVSESMPPTGSPTGNLVLSDRESGCTGEEPCGKCLGKRAIASAPPNWNGFNY